jgi:hypothetical protein
LLAIRRAKALAWEALPVEEKLKALKTQREWHELVRRRVAHRS